jgi:hypothetical protein
VAGTFKPGEFAGATPHNPIRTSQRTRILAFMVLPPEHEQSRFKAGQNVNGKHLAKL